MMFRFVILVIFSLVLNCAHDNVNPTKPNPYSSQIINVVDSNNAPIKGAVASLKFLLVDYPASKKLANINNLTSNLSTSGAQDTSNMEHFIQLTDIFTHSGEKIKTIQFAYYVDSSLLIVDTANTDCYYIEDIPACIPAYWDCTDYDGNLVQVGFYRGKSRTYYFGTDSLFSEGELKWIRVVGEFDTTDVNGEITIPFLPTGDSIQTYETNDRGEIISGLKTFSGDIELTLIKEGYTTKIDSMNIRTLSNIIIMEKEQ